MNRIKLAPQKKPVKFRTNLKAGPMPVRLIEKDDGLDPDAPETL